MAILCSRLVSGNSPGSDGAVGIEQEHGAGGVADQSRLIDPDTIAWLYLVRNANWRIKWRRKWWWGGDEDGT